MTKQESTRTKIEQIVDNHYKDVRDNTTGAGAYAADSIEKLLDQEANKRVVEALEELATKAVGVCVFPEDIDAVIEKYKPEEEV